MNGVAGVTGGERAAIQENKAAAGIAGSRRRGHARRLGPWPIMILAAGLFGVAAHGQIVLNEIMSDNQGAVENGPDFPDYIELHNRGAAAANVGNMSVTDDLAVPRKYVIPVGTSIPSGGYLILWADSNTTSPGLHTGFGLGANTDRVQLYGADGVSLLDDIPFGIAVPNYSIGRVPNGTGQWTLNQPTPLAANVGQALGARTDLHINEWLASPATGEDWLEVYNANALPVDLGGLVITDTVGGVPDNRPIPALSFIGGNGYVQFFASNLEEEDADHLDFRLGAGGETLTIYNSDLVTVLETVTFGSQSANTSQGRAPDGSENIIFFPAGVFTPEAPNQTAITNVVISEVLTHTDPPLEDAIELQNVTAQEVDISHWWLSDSASQPQKYRIPAGTTIAPFGFKVFYEGQFGVGPTGFSLNSAEGDEVYLSAGNASGNLLGAQGVARVGGLRNGVSAGRYVTSDGVDFVPLSARTFGVDNPTTLLQFRTGTGLSNAAPIIGPIVISEFHYSPPGLPDVADLDEFVELHNPTAGPVSLFDPDFPTNTWRLRDGITFDIPANTTIAAGGFLLVVNFDPIADPTTLASFRQRFAVPAGVPIVGPYQGKLSNSGENVRLSRPDHPETSGPNTGLVPYEQVEAIDYSAIAPWPTGAAGTGSSLHRTQLLGYGNEPTNWFAAAPTPGRGDSVSTDNDSDGMPNDYEIANGLNPDFAGDADLDADSDGATNLAEYRAGTNPQSAQSVLKFTSIQSLGATAQLRFLAVAGKSYELQSRAQLGIGSWGTISNIPAPGATGEITLTAPAGGSAGFYRVIVSETP
jgi:hypothetical protein